MGNLEFSDFTVIIPTINEKENISKLIDLLLQLYPNICIVVSDDGSSDGTQEVVLKYNMHNSKIRLLDRSKEEVQGLTASVLDAADGVNTDYLLVMDGDLQHPPALIKDILEALSKEGDLVICWRKKDLSGKSRHRRFITKLGKTLGRWRLSTRGISCRDVLSGYFGIRTELFKEIVGSDKRRFELEGYKVLFDLLKLIPTSTKIKEISFTFGPRGGGESKMKMKHIIIFIRSLLN